MGLRVHRSLAALVVLSVWLLPLCPAHADADICSTASCSGQTAIGSIAAGSSSLALRAAKDFANGQDIRIDHAGAAATVGTPTGLTVSSVGEKGSSRYSYRVVSLGPDGSLGAATPPTGDADGNPDLTPNNYIEIKWTAPSGSKPAAYAVWRSVDDEPYQFLRIINSVHFWDFGIVEERPTWVPATPPDNPLAGWHVTTIASGGGTTKLTLAAAAATAVTDTQIVHDDSKALGAAVEALNAAGGGYALTCPSSARIRTTTPPPPITVGDAYLIGRPGCELKPAGFGSALRFHGARPGTKCTLAADFTEGSIRITLASAAGFRPGDYIVLQRDAPMGPGGGRAVPYWYASPIRSVHGNVATMVDPTSVLFPQHLTTVTLTGTFAPGKTITLNFSGLPPKTIAVEKGATNQSLARDLALAVASAPPAANATAWSSSNTAFIYLPASMSGTVTGSTSGAGTVTVTRTPDQATTCNKWAPVSRVGIQDISVDAIDLIGDAASMGIVQLSGLADWRIKGMRGRNVHAGGLVYGSLLYSGVIDDWEGMAASAGAPNFTSYSDLWIDKAMIVQYRLVRSRRPLAFGPSFFSVMWLQGGDLYQAGAEAGRGYKLGAVSGYTIDNIITNSTVYTNYASAYGTRRGTISGLLSFGGERGLLGNGTCVWFSDQFNQLNQYRDVQTTNCYQDDWSSGPSDQRNAGSGVLVDGLNTIRNHGLTRFRDINGHDAASGNAAPTTAHGLAIAPASPQVEKDLRR